MRLRFLALVASIAVLTVACGDDAPDQPPVPAPPPPELAPELEPEVAVDIPEETSIRLLDPGSEPRQVLRFTVPEGTAQEVRIATRTDVSVTVDGRPVEKPVAIEGTELVLRLVAGECRADGAVDLTFEITDVAPILRGDTSADEIASYRRKMASSVGIHGSAVRTTSGLCRVTSVAPPPGVLGPKPRSIDESMQQSMDAIAVPLPPDAIGPGARWEVVSPRTRGGARLRVTSTYELLGRDGNRIILDVTTRQQAAATDVRLPGLDPRARSRLRRIDADGTGRVEASLTGIVPDLSTLTLTEKAVFLVTDPQHETVMRRTTRLDFTIEAD